MKPNIHFKEYRKGLGLSQVDFAKKLSVSQGTITDIERGRIGVSKNVRKKIQQNFGTESGYFDPPITNNNNEINQGSESGYNQGFMRKSSMVTVIQSDSEQAALATKRIDASKVPFAEIVELMTQKSGEIVFLNISQDAVDKLWQLFDKQRFVSEKAITDMQANNKEFVQFKASINAIKSIQNLLDNMTFSHDLNDVFTATGLTRENFNKSLGETKDFLSQKFKNVEPYAAIFNNLAKAMIVFANKAKSIPSDVSDIDKEEFEEYLELNS